MRAGPGTQAGSSIEYDRTGRVLFGVVLAIGVALRAIQWLDNPPLWLDELALANGVLSGTFFGLFDGAADFAQAAPPGFLAVEWVVARALPGSDLALRLPSFLFGCAALPVTWLAAREVVGERHAWLAPVLITFGGQLIFMSGQVKPYSADAFFAPLILACALRNDRARTAGSWRALALSGAVGPLFSFGAVFVNAGVAAYLFLRRRDRAELAAMFTMFAMWAVTALVAVIVSRRLLSREANELMADFWKPWYPPVPPTSVEDVLWPARRIAEMLYSLVGLREVWFFSIALLASAVAAWRQRPALGVLLLTPIAAAFVAAVIRQFPFGDRLLHWVVPIFALLFTVLASRVMGWLRQKARWLELAPAGLLLGTPVLSLAMAPPPYMRDNITPVLERLSTEARPGDVLYVFRGAWHSWYRYGRPLEPAFASVIPGGCPRDSPRGYLREMDQFRGKPRVWFVFGRVQVAAEQELRLAYLDAIGIRSEELLVPAPGADNSSRVDLYRYDFSNTSRLTLTTAESFPIPEEIVRREIGCSRYDAMWRRADGTRVTPLL